MVSSDSIEDQLEYLPEWVPLKSVIGEDAAEIWVASEKDSVHIPGLTLEPVSAQENGGDGGDWGHLITVCFHPDPSIVPVAQKVVHNLEAEGLSWVIHSADIDHLPELGLGVILQEAADFQEQEKKKMNSACCRPSSSPKRSQNKDFITYTMRGVMCSGAVMTVSWPWWTSAFWMNLGITLSK